MNTHYIPRLLLRKFAEKDKINTYDFCTKSFYTKKLKNAFSEPDLFDEELEKLFASKLEGPMGNLLNHKLLVDNHITINRTENMLLRKFLMINYLRAPIVNGTWEEMLDRTQLWNHPSAQAREFLLRHKPELREMFEQGIPSADSYIPDLKMAMSYDSIEELTNPENEQKISNSLRNAALHSMVGAIAFWDSTQSGLEFILPKLPGISMMDQVSSLYKNLVLCGKREELESKGISEILKLEFYRLEDGSLFFSDNFSVYPISSTRVLICFSPYFRAFFPIMDDRNRVEIYPPILKREQFDRHFFKPMRLELFRPCKCFENKAYQYEVQSLTAEEVMFLNAMLLDMETEEFAFHDYNKIRDSFWYYDNRAQFALPKKHDFSHMG